MSGVLKSPCASNQTSPILAPGAVHLLDPGIDADHGGIVAGDHRHGLGVAQTGRNVAGSVRTKAADSHRRRAIGSLRLRQAIDSRTAPDRDSRGTQPVEQSPIDQDARTPPDPSR